MDRYSFEVTDLTQASPDACADALDELRRTNSHRVLPVDTGPLYDIRAALLPGGVTRLFVGFDILALDMAGWITLMREWGARVGGRSDFPPLGASFPEIVRARKADPDQSRRRAADREYWATRAPELPGGPNLPWLAAPHSLGLPRFTRCSTELDSSAWDSLRRASASRGLTPTAVLLASFAMTLRCWGATEKFALNTTLFDREHPDVEQTTAESIGDFTTTVLVEMPLADDCDFATFASAVNHRFWSDMGHRTVSGVEVLRLGPARASTPAPGADSAQLPGPSHPVVFTSGLGLSDGNDSPLHGWDPKSSASRRPLRCCSITSCATTVADCASHGTPSTERSIPTSCDRWPMPIRDFSGGWPRTTQPGRSAPSRTIPASIRTSRSR